MKFQKGLSTKEKTFFTLSLILQLLLLLPKQSPFPMSAFYINAASQMKRIVTHGRSPPSRLKSGPVGSSNINASQTSKGFSGVKISLHVLTSAPSQEIQLSRLSMAPTRRSSRLSWLRGRGIWGHFVIAIIIKIYIFTTQNKTFIL